MEKPIQEIEMLGTENKKSRLPKGKALAVAIIRIFAVVAAAGGFVLYVLAHKGYKPADFAAPFVTLALFTAIFVIAAPKLVDTLVGESSVEFLEKSASKRAWRNFFVICLGALLLHIVLGVIGTVIYKNANDYAASIKDPIKLWQNSWMKSNTDAGHYLKIAENWYVKEGNDRLLIVFFPMLPVLIRAFSFVFKDSFISAQILNAIATALASGMVYMTLLPIIGSRRSKVGAFVAILLPGMIFMNSPMSEPLFLLFTVCAFFFMQRKQFILSGIFVALAGFTRSLGVIAAIPLGIVGIGHIVRLIRDKKSWGRELILLAVGLVISTFGTLGYLYINYSIHGDALKFFEYQSGNWYQNFNPFFDTPRYMISYAQRYYNEGSIDKLISLWIPGLIAVVGSLLLIGSKARRLPASYTIYFLAYFAVAIGCTWLLSAMRYISAALPVTAAIAHCANKRWKVIVLFIILGVLYIAYMYMYMMRWEVY